MNTTATMEEVAEITINSPGRTLAELRERKGYNQEYVANKLHLRVRIIEQLEADDYPNMPESVFIKGYLRAYAKLLGTDPAPFIENYNLDHGVEKKIEKNLWQSRRETNKAERMVRWFTVLFALGVLVSIGIWWQKNKDSQDHYSTQTSQNNLMPLDKSADIGLTDLSKMESIIASSSEITPMENNGG